MCERLAKLEARVESYEDDLAELQCAMAQSNRGPTFADVANQSVSTPNLGGASAPVASAQSNHFLDSSYSEQKRWVSSSTKGLWT